MKEANWSKAPKDATHFGGDTQTYQACWYKKQLGMWWFMPAKRGALWHPMQNPPTQNRFGRMELRP